MENTAFDLSNCTRDGLHLVLSTAKDELAKYNDCHEKVENCKKRIEEEKKKEKDGGYTRLGCTYTFGALVFIFAFALLSMYVEQHKDGASLIGMAIVGVVVLLFLFYIYRRTILNLKRAEAQAQIEITKYESQLPDLQKEEVIALDALKAAWIIPEDYRYLNAVSKMLKYVENKEASTWERVTDLYKVDMHHMTMQEQARMQTDLAHQTLSASRRTAAGAWAAAAGIWIR
jgi:hypothetical protein